MFDPRAADGRLEVARGGAERPDATIETDAATLAALVYEGLPLVEGDESAVERFLSLFPLPEPAATAEA